MMAAFTCDPYCHDIGGGHEGAWFDFYLTGIYTAEDVMTNNCFYFIKPSFIDNFKCAPGGLLLTWLEY